MFARLECRDAAPGDGSLFPTVRAAFLIAVTKYVAKETSSKKG